MIGDSGRVGAFLAAVFAAAAILSAYLPLWLADHGVASAQIGLVLGVASLLRVVFVPACGWATDRLGRHRAALGLASALAALYLAGLPAAHGAIGIAALVVLGGIAASALPAITDALTIALAAAGRLEYGPTRAWGSVAYMLATAGAGFLLGRFGSALVPWLLGGGYGAAALLAILLPSGPAAPYALAPAAPCALAPAAPCALAPAAPARLGPDFRRALLATMLIQGSHAAYYAFASLHWRQAGIADGTIGLLIGEGIIAEIGLFLWGRGLVERLGPSRLTALAACACLLRWSVLAATVSVPILAAVQLLHAATFACQHLSTMIVLRAIPPSRAAFSQTAMAAIGFSAPTGVLTWLSGQLYGALGGLVFLLMAAIGGAALLVAPSLPGGARHRSA